jgi:hypothetical protein
VLPVFIASALFGPILNCWQLRCKVHLCIGDGNRVATKISHLSQRVVLVQRLMVFTGGTTIGVFKTGTAGVSPALSAANNPLQALTFIEPRAWARGDPYMVTSSDGLAVDR